MNSGAERLFGYSQEEVIGQDIDDLINTPDTVEEAISFTQIVVDGRELSPVETVRYRKDGSPVDVIVAGAPILVRDELVGVVAVYTDITERKRAEEALKQRAAQLAVLNDIGGEIAALLDLDSVLDRAARLVQESFGYHHVAVFTLNQESPELVMNYILRGYVPDGLGLAYKGKPVIPGEMVKVDDDLILYLTKELRAEIG